MKTHLTNCAEAHNFYSGEKILEQETSNVIMQSINLVELMRDAKSPDIPDGPIYEDESICVDKKDGKVLLTGKPIKNPIIYKEKK